MTGTGKYSISHIKLEDLKGGAKMNTNNPDILFSVGREYGAPSIEYH